MRPLFISILVFLLAFQVSFAQTKEAKAENKTVKVTFIELGSVKCIPCRKMEAVLDSIREKFPKDVEVIFYDVWTKAGKPYAKQFGIESIPTQVFLDEKGKEYYRHTGYFEEIEVIKILQQKQVEK